MLLGSSPVSAPLSEPQAGLDHPQELLCQLWLQESTFPSLAEGIKADSSLLLLNFSFANQQLLLSMKRPSGALMGSPRRGQVGDRS